VLHSFAGVKPGQVVGDGASPNGGLVLDSTGAIYGTTFYGGNESGVCKYGVGGSGCGTLYKLVPPVRKAGKWKEEMVRRFQGADGDNPAAGVTLRGDGVYGTTMTGGPGGGAGTVFRMTPPPKRSAPWKESILYGFSGDEHGSAPIAGLTFDSAGHVYSTTNGGTPQCHYGNVFRMNPRSGNTRSWALTILYGFTGGSDGEYPATGVVFDENGDAYGTTQSGGTGGACQGGCGTVFKVSP
jgi:hypothetical protein